MVSGAARSRSFESAELRRCTSVGQSELAARMLGHKNTVKSSKTYGELTKGVVRATLPEG